MVTTRSISNQDSPASTPVTDQVTQNATSEEPQEAHTEPSPIDTPSKRELQARVDALKAELRASKLEYELKAIQTTAARQIRPVESQTGLTAAVVGIQLPKPNPPSKFESRNRTNWDNWARDCERFFRLSPQNFPSEVSKIVFATQYLGRLQMDRWERVEPTLTQDERNWATLKETMLDMMGNREERAQRAYEKIKKAYQGNKTPTEFLDYLRRLWDDAGEDRETHKMRDYRAALNYNIRNRLQLSARTFESLAELEEAANEAERWIKEGNKAQTNDKSHKRTYSKHDESQKDQGESRRGRGGYRGRYRYGRGGRSDSGKSNSDKKKSNQPITCYSCNKEGHIAPNCPEKKSKETPTSK